MTFFLHLLIFIALVSCSSQKNAGGTASEGESFVYGYVVDSTSQNASLLKPRMVDARNNLVILSQLSYTDTGLVSVWEDSVYTDHQGYYQLKTPPTGVYSLFAHSTSMSTVVYASFEVPDSGLDLGRIGMHQPVGVHGSFAGASPCLGNMRVSMPGTAQVSVSDANSSFQFAKTPPGRSLLLAQCGDTVKQWHLVLPGSCASVALDSIPWNSKSGSGIQGIQGSGWSWQMGPPLVVNENCKLVRNGPSSNRE